MHSSPPKLTHNAGSAITHKSQAGTYQAFAIDIGCYAHLRKLDGRFNELSISDRDAKEKLRSAPVFDAAEFDTLFKATPKNVEAALLDDVEPDVGDATGMLCNKALVPPVIP